MSLKATVFEFTSYQFEPAKRRVVFNYKTHFSGQKPVAWTETIILPKAPKNEVPKKLLESLHIILGISYYKYYLGKVTLPYQLSKSEAEFWNAVYKKGLGEFFYKNKLNPHISPKFPVRVTSNQEPVTRNLRVTGYTLPVTAKCLVGIGGGKDSIVSVELLKQGKFDATGFIVETGKGSEIMESIVKTAGIGVLKIRRHLDWQVHQKHQYNGHIPVSAIYAFLGILACVLYDYKYVIVSNEHSSNFGSLTYKGLEINHQWSKSFEFEKLFRNYVKNFISPDVEYFSLLRPFHEIRIVKLFSKYKKYFPYFSSCNRNFTVKDKQHQGLWCGQCAKCVFAFTLLSAYLSKRELLGIFGKNLYQDKSLLSLFKDILGFGSMKPFDCVGTFKEAQTALVSARRRFRTDFIVRQFGARAKLSPEVFGAGRETGIPEPFKFLGMGTALVLGYGKEGEVTKKYLQKQYPKLSIGIADVKEGIGYLKKQSHYDIAIKTPGIKKELVTIPYTTATNIFFAQVKGKNTIIGVTGSKGKSTTSSLIYHILKTAGKDAQLLGNIGTPMLQALLQPIPKNRIFVLELSSYQLDDVKFSPDIAVVTSLFPEHMDFHGSLEKYYTAKKNIIHFQGENDYFVCSPRTAGWLKDYPGKAVPFFPMPKKSAYGIPHTAESSIGTKEVFESNLIGRHNQSNIQAAAALAGILNIPHEKIKKAVKSFKGLPHRLENVGTYQGITFYDDAISTTPESTIMAIKALGNVGTIFLGGQDRGYDFSQLEKTIKKYKINNVVLFPDSGDKILKNKKGLKILRTKSMKEAVVFAYKNTKKGSVCLLSCASPSYSLWKNFEQKGDQFKKFVKSLGK